MAENENRPLAADGVEVERIGLQLEYKAVALAKCCCSLLCRNSSSQGLAEDAGATS